MNILVTAGNTQALIDQVRCITSIFSGKTGTSLAVAAHRRGHAVTLLTSRPEVVKELGFEADASRWQQQAYRTFEDLQTQLEREVTAGNYDAIIHSAAVSDYLCAGTYVPASGTSFDPVSASWSATGLAKMQDVSRGKVKSSHQELWLRLKTAPKLVDLIRPSWGFQGLLVKFKLEVGVTETELQQIAEQSRLQSQADLMVANTLEGMHDWALVGADEYQKVPRKKLANRVIELLELHGHRQNL